MGKEKVIVTVLNYNEEDYTEACVNSLKKQSYKDFEIVVVDNASKEEGLARLKKNLKGVKLIENEKNTGFVGGYNTGIEYSKKNGAKYAVIVNNDTVVDKDWLTELVKIAEKDSKVGIVGSKALFLGERNTVQSAGIGFNKAIAFYYDRGFGEKDLGQYDKQEELIAVSGVSMLINLAMGEELIYFDKDFFMYMEDIDLCERVGRAGYKIIYNPRSILEHKFSLTANKVSGLKTYYGVRNRLRVLKRYHSFLTYFVAYMRAMVRGFLNLFTFNPTLIISHFKALVTV